MQHKHTVTYGPKHITAATLTHTKHHIHTCKREREHTHTDGRFSQGWWVLFLVKMGGEEGIELWCSHPQPLCVIERNFEAYCVYEVNVDNKANILSLLKTCTLMHPCEQNIKGMYLSAKRRDMKTHRCTWTVMLSRIFSTHRNKKQARHYPHPTPLKNGNTILSTFQESWCLDTSTNNVPSTSGLRDTLSSDSGGVEGFCQDA